MNALKELREMMYFLFDFLLWLIAVALAASLLGAGAAVGCWVFNFVKGIL